jgi:SAM-dependent methyltransferase
VASQRDEHNVRELFSRLVAAGFDDDNVARWFGVPLVTDSRWVARPPARPRRGLGAWIALLVAGDPLPLASFLPAPSAEELDALVALGLVTVEDSLVRAEVTALPWRGLVIVSPKAEAFDVSALNVAASLPRARTLWDVGCGAGLLTVAAARNGARVLGSDVDGGLVGWARLNCVINDVAAELVAADLMSAAAPQTRFDAIVFNAPLLRAPLAVADEAPRYTSSPRGEALALAFLEGARAHLLPGGSVLLHAQLTGAVDAALDGWAADAAVLTVVFAYAPDGTAHALSEIRRDRPPGRRRARVPLSAACPHLSRPILDALAAPRTLEARATPLPAPWLELRTSERFDEGGARWSIATTFGGVPLDGAELLLLDRLRGPALGTLALGGQDRERLESLVERGLVILR